MQNKYRQKLIGINNSLGDHFGIIGDKLLRKICFFYINQVSPNISKLFDFLPFVNVTILLKPTELLLMFPWKYQFSLNFIMFWKIPLESWYYLATRHSAINYHCFQQCLPFNMISPPNDCCCKHLHCETWCPKMSSTMSIDHDMSHVLGFENETMQIKNVF